MTPYLPPSEKLRPDQIIHIAQLIQQQLGLIYNGNKLNDLKRRLNHVLKEIPERQHEQTIAHLLAGEFERIPNLIAELTIPETYFLRNIRLFKALKSKILPEIIERKKYSHQINIWSAGCSSGEEPYSVAILLHEILQEKISQWKIQLIATDLNENILQKARRAVYSEWSFRGVPPDFKARYFSPLPQALYQLKPEIKETVSFFQHNLIEGSYPPTRNVQNFDLILCRNVLIYMSHTTVQTILEKFYGILNDWGYLITGPSEFPTLKNKKFKPVIIEETIFYQKAKQHAPALRQPTPDTRKKRFSPRQPFRIKAPFPKKKTDFSLEIVKKDEKKDKIKPLVSKTLDSVRNSANLGHLDEALEYCKQYVKHHITDKHGYYLMGTILTEKGDLKEAETYFKRAIFLDPDFVMAHFALANVYAATERTDQAQKQFRNVLNILKTMAPSEPVPEGEGMVVSHLLEMVNQLQTAH